MNLKTAVASVEKHGMLLVFPLDNRPEPRSLWSEFYPRSPMRWEWDETGDDRVGRLWRLREQLSVSRQVVYSKWFRGRATVLSLDLMVAMLTCFASTKTAVASSLSPQARELLDLLNEDSPQSTKTLKRAADLQGREQERLYNSAMKELWSRLLITVFGEVDEGAFPSLAIGSTQVLFEDLWQSASKMPVAKAKQTIERHLPLGTPFRKYFDQVEKSADKP